ncbi:MAG: YibE/F family protein [Acidimicrobiia bacterium]|nr:YibE/F family protein [Acidimicrobiia bacterium]NNL69598.1 YibE/F family protein [Acidimicrobiia bacterium]
MSDPTDPIESSELADWEDFVSTPVPPAPRARFFIGRRALMFIAAGGAVVVVIGLILLWPGRSFQEQPGELADLVVAETYEAEIIDIAPGPCENCIDVTFAMTAGPDEGRLVDQVFSVSQLTSFDIGDRVVMGYRPDADEDFQYQFFDRQRRAVLWWVALLFAGAVVALGRLRGLAALAGLVASLAVLFWFVLPGILDGQPPVLVAVVGAAAVAYLALYVAHGFRPLTTVALVGTLSALVLTVLLSSVVVEAAQLTGFASEEASFLTLFSEELDFRGLVLAGIVLGAMGALDDVTVTQASAVWELRAADPTMTPGDLFRAGLRIGRDHIASTVNTLVLAYSGAALPLLALFVLSEQSLGSLANSEAVATEIIRTLVGSIGLVAAVPLTTWLAAHAAVEDGSPSGRV